MAIKSSKFDPKNGVEMAIFPNIIKISYVLRRLADAATRDLFVGVHALTVIDICFTKARSSAFARRQYGDRFGNLTIQTSHCQSQLVVIELIEQYSISICSKYIFDIRSKTLLKVLLLTQISSPLLKQNV